MTGVAINLKAWVVQAIHEMIVTAAKVSGESENRYAGNEIWPHRKHRYDSGRVHNTHQGI